MTGAYGSVGFVLSFRTEARSVFILWQYGNFFIENSIHYLFVLKTTILQLLK